MATLGQAKTYPELVQRLNKELLAGATDKDFVPFMMNHLKLLARINDQRSWAACKFYHYGLWDEFNSQKEEDKARFYLVNMNGNVDLTGQLHDSYPMRKNQQQQGGNRGGKTNGNNGNNSSFRGRGRGRGAGAGRGNPSSTQEPGLG